MGQYKLFLFILTLFNIANAKVISNNDFIQVDNIKIDVNSITSENTDGNIILNPNGAGGVVFNDLTATTVPYLDANKKLVSSSVTPTQLSYVDFTSSGQTQLDALTTATQNLGFYSGNIAGTNVSLSTSSVSTYTEFGNSALTLTVNTDSNSMGIACDAPGTETQEVGDTACAGSEGNEIVGVVITPASTARYLRACFAFSNAAQDAGSGTNLVFQGTFQLTATENNSTTILSNGQDRGQFTFITNSGSGAEVVTVGQSFYVCGNFKFADTNIKRITLRYEQAVSGTLASHVVYADAATSAGQRDIGFFGYYLQ